MPVLTLSEVARDVLLELVRKSGVREYADPQTQIDLADAAVAIAERMLGIDEDEVMAVTAVLRQQAGTSITFKSSAGTAALSLASVSNGAYRESVKADCGATRAQLYAVHLDVEIAATPTAGNTIDVWVNSSSSATAGTDNRGGTAGADQAYTGYSSNAAASVKQLIFVGSFVCTAQATATVQKGFVGFVSLPQRYNSVVVLNGSGAAIHTSDSNCVLTFIPVEFTSEPS